MAKSFFRIDITVQDFTTADAITRIIKEVGVVRYICAETEMYLYGDGNFKIDGVNKQLTDVEDGPYTMWAFKIYCNFKQYFKLNKQLKAAGF